MIGQIAELDRTSFRTIAALAYGESGLTLVEEKTTMIQSRLRHRLFALNMSNFSQYCAHIQSDSGMAERKRLISALTTNVSHFFREDHHFDALCDYVGNALPDLRAGGRLRIWSAGCANGQEPVSAAIRLLEDFPEVADLDLRILATDIDQNVVRFANAGRYPEKLMNGVPKAICDKYFVAETMAEKGGEQSFVTRASIKRLIRFNELNLLAPWPMKGLFDIIFCRNVLIYFDLATQNKLWPRFSHALRPGGLLFLGHSERIASPSNFGFECSGPTAYRPLNT